MKQALETAFSLAGRIKRITGDEEVRHLANLIEDTLKAKSGPIMVKSIRDEFSVSGNEVYDIARFMGFKINGLDDLTYEQLDKIYLELKEMRERRLVG